MQAWETFLKELEEKFGKETIQKWLRSLKVVQYDAANLYLEAEDYFQANWFEEHIRPLLGGFKNNNDRQVRVHLALSGKKEEKKKAMFFSPSFSITPDSPDPLMTFAHFCPLETNQLAYKLLSQIPTSTTSSFNPIYIYGNSGTGKSHLLSALALGLQQRGKKVFFVHAETFTNHVVGAMRQGAMQEFRKAYRYSDALLIDDVHLFSRKSATQEEFFHTFNTLHTMGYPIILTANVAPQMLIAIEPRLVSRFEWGITIPLQEPKKEDLLQVLLKKSEILNIPLAEESFPFLLESFSYNLKKIAVALQALLLRKSHLPNKVDPPFLKQVLKDFLEEEKKSGLTSETILRQVALYFGIRIEDLLGKSQTREASLPRQIAIYLCRERLKMPYQRIGELFSRDHSTIMTSVKTIAKNHVQKEELQAALAEISKNLR